MKRKAAPALTAQHKRLRTNRDGELECGLVDV